MKSILEELWWGNLCPDTILGRMSTEEKELAEHIMTHHEKLESLLDDKQKKIFEKYNDCREEYSTFSDKQIFTYGFCLGARIAFEVMSKDFE